MSTYAASTTGSHALTAGVTALRVTITTFPPRYGNGRANPTNYYDIALLRFSDGTAFWSPVAIQGGPHWIGVPSGATSVYWSCLGGAELSIMEVIGGVNPFYGPNPSLESLSDVSVTGIADAQVLAWNASAGLWENVTPASAPTIVTATAHLTADQGTAPNTFADGPSLSLAAGTWLVTAVFSWRAFAGANSNAVARLLQGATVISSSDRTVNASWSANFALVGLAVLTETTTVKAQCCGDTEGTILATPQVNNTGALHTAATIVAVKVS